MASAEENCVCALCVCVQERVCASSRCAVVELACCKEGTKKEGRAPRGNDGGQRVDMRASTLRLCHGRSSLFHLNRRFLFLSFILTLARAVTRDEHVVLLWLLSVLATTTTVTAAVAGVTDKPAEESVLLSPRAPT